MALGNPDNGIGTGVGLGGGIGLGAGGRNIGGSYDLTSIFDPYILPNIAARYDASLASSLTVNSSNRVSAWADQGGGGNTLLQGTGANQPLYLPWSGSNYLAGLGVLDNFVSTPSAAANQITGDIDIRVKLSAVTWTPAAAIALFQKWSGSWVLNLNTAGTLTFFGSYSISGTVGATSSAATGFSANSINWVRVTRALVTGFVTFYTSQDGVTWTQLGTVQTVAATQTLATTTAVTVGGITGTSNAGLTSTYRAELYNGINGTRVLVMDPSQTTNNAASWVSSTGETWTVNRAGALVAQIVGSPSVVFDAAAYKMAVSFTLVQPVARYSVFVQRTWASGKYIWDGASAGTGGMKKVTSTPDLEINAGSDGPLLATFTLNNFAVAAEVINGGSSTLARNLATAATGDTGAGNPGGYTVGSDGGGANFGSVQLCESLIYNTAHSAATQAQVIQFLMSKWSLS